jgi:uncharacterized protein YbcV (DUF1398 family)
MDAELITIAKDCVAGAHSGSLSFPQIVGKLIAAGFEGYTVDYRRKTQTFYRPDGESIVLDMPPSEGAVAAAFDADTIRNLVHWAQSNPPDYSYKAFCEKAKAAGCAGYIVSFLGRRVLYLGRTAETHTELFPS